MFTQRHIMPMTLFLWNLVNPVKIYHGIIVRQHLIDLRRMGLPEERAVPRIKEGTAAVMLQSGWDEK